MGGEEEQVEGKREAAEEGNGKGEEGPKEGNKVEGDKEKGKGKAKVLVSHFFHHVNQMTLL